MIQNNPTIWLPDFPFREKHDHKYTHGHAVIFGAPKMTGATRLAALACARIGAGLTTVIAPEGAGDIYRRTLEPHIIVRDRDDDLWPFLKDERITAMLIGPGAGDGHDALKADIANILTLNKQVVIDADGLNALEKPVLNPQCVLTPHEGEFRKLFPGLRGTREEKVLYASQQTGAVVVLKGAETLIAFGDECAKNTNAPPELATAGTGDVLAGMITGLLAQGMEPFQAACAAVWIHGEAAKGFGPGLVASDLPDRIPAVLRELT